MQRAARSRVRQWQRGGAYLAMAAAMCAGSACANGLEQGGKVPAGYYRVNPGDTLSSIAHAYGQQVLDVAKWNRIADISANVTPGKVLRMSPNVPPPTVAASVSPEAAGAASEAKGASEAKDAKGASAASAASGASAPAVASSHGKTKAAGESPEKPALDWPVHGPVLQTFSDGKSTGILIGGAANAEVHAAAAGRVVYVGTSIKEYGTLIIIKHSNSMVSAYGRNGKVLIKQDDQVAKGQPIAEMDTDANDKGGVPVWFEVRISGKPVDPLPLLPKK